MERAVMELLAMLQSAALEVSTDAPWDEQAAEGFRRHHSHLMYKACMYSCMPFTNPPRWHASVDLFRCHLTSEIAQVPVRL